MFRDIVKEEPQTRRNKKSGRKPANWRANLWFSVGKGFTLCFTGLSRDEAIGLFFLFCYINVFQSDVLTLTK